MGSRHCMKIKAHNMKYNSTLIATFSILALFSFSYLPPAAAWSNGMAASYVIGQTGFNLNASATTAAGLSSPSGVVVDPATGKVFICDEGNNRVLRYPSTAAMANGASAEAVLGQSSFTTKTTGTTSTTLSTPYALAINSTGSLWVADGINNRVLRFDNAATIASGAAANGVLGQAGFTTNTSATTSTGMFFPSSVAVSGTTLWVCDADNNRILRFDNAASLANGAAAGGVLGQSGFTTKTTALTATGLNEPIQVYASTSGGLWVADAVNIRVLLYNNAASLANGSAANLVLGQTTFTTATTGTTVNKFKAPDGVAGDGNGAIYVADGSNNRIMIFNNGASLANGASANYVLGQSSFTTSGSGDAANQLNDPAFLYVGSSLLVPDYVNNRVLNYIPMAPLPLTLTGFTATLQGKDQVLLQWQTADGATGGTFNLQYGADTSAFTTILNSQPCNPDKESYSYLQTNPARGIDYYRLQLTDPGGNITYSPVLTVSVAAAVTSAPSLFPNPAHNSVTITLPASAAPAPATTLAVIRLFNSAGQLVKTVTTPNATTTIDVSGLAPGFYVVQVMQGQTLTTCSFIRANE